jgi:hypothetical protein
MSEVLSTKTIICIKDIDPFDSIYDAKNQKAILAMQATKAFVLEDDNFEQLNNQLKVVAKKISKPATMTYEDLIFTNPVYNQTRVVSEDPLTAEHEAYFYRAHRDIEGHLANCVEILLSRQIAPDNAQIAAGEMASAVNNIGQLYANLEPSDFTAFRPFFVGLNGYPGPSGLYSETIPILDLLVHGGSNIDHQQEEVILSNIFNGLYANNNGYNNILAKLLVERPETNLDSQNQTEMARLLNAFRKAHHNSVRKFVPEALTGQDAGSGGVTNVAEFLVSKFVNKDV